MTRYTLKILPEDRIVEAREGQDLLSALVDSGLPIVQGCGGRGVCGRCEVEIINPAIGLALACQTPVDRDMVVYVPPETRVGHSSLDLARVWELEPVSADPTLFKGSIRPEAPVRHVALNLEVPNLDDNISDLDRIETAMRVHLNLTRDVDITLSPETVRRLPSVLRESDWRVFATADLAIEHCAHIFDVRPAANGPTLLGIAIDCGTTTLAASLVDLEQGKPIASAGCLNPQVRYGADVISRIIYAAQPEGMSNLQAAVVKGICRLCDKLLESANVEGLDIKAVAVAGNTTMMHLLHGVDPASIRREPYVPAFSRFPTIGAGELGLPIHPDAPVYSLPGVASYVGADISAGVLASGLADSEELTAFVDLGTNGEIVVGSREWMICCSASAGPCFEGGGIIRGCPAISGAIDKVTISSEGELEYSVIGGGKPMGICGSGLVDLVACLLEIGVLDRQGKFVHGSSPRLRETDWGASYILAEAGATANGTDIFLTEPDVANFIRAKAAIYAGLETAFELAGAKMSDARRVLVAGGMGGGISPRSAKVVGLFPALSDDRFKAVGNTSLLGAQLALISKPNLRRCKIIADSMTNVDLSVEPSYTERYSAALFLPHTDLAKFTQHSTLNTQQDLS